MLPICVNSEDAYDDEEEADHDHEDDAERDGQHLCPVPHEEAVDDGGVGNAAGHANGGRVLNA